MMSNPMEGHSEIYGALAANIQLVYVADAEANWQFRDARQWKPKESIRADAGVFTAVSTVCVCVFAR